MAKNNFNISLCTLNVNGLIDSKKSRLLLTQLSLYPKVNVFALQETHTATVSTDNFLVFSSPGSSRSCGCTTLIRKQFLIDNHLEVVNHRTISQGRLLVVKLRSTSSTLEFSIINIYAPNPPGERKRFYSETLLPALDIGSFYIILGDFNCYMSPNDSTSVSATKKDGLEGRVEIESICNVLQLDEGNFQGNSDRFTWHHPNAQVASRLDRVYKPKDWCAHFYHKHCAFSDHCMVFCDVSLSGVVTSSENRSFWKLNTSILTESNYQAQIDNLFRDFCSLRPYYDTASSFWEALKSRIRKVTITYCKNRKQNYEGDIIDLENKINQLRCSPNQTPADKAEIVNCRLLLDALSKQRLEGIFVRTRLDREFYDEKATSFFFDRIRHRRSKGEIKAIRGPDSQIHSDQTSIEHLFTQFYRDLYGKAGDLNLETQSGLLSEFTESPDIDHESSISPTKESLRKIMYDMKCNKTPGPDGIPVEFYKQFFEMCAPILMEVYSEIIEKEILPSSMLESVFVLLNKEGDQLDMANKRPISLLNTDYKIFASFLKDQALSEHLGQVISNEQLCGIKGRSIQDGVCLLRDVIDYYRGSRSNYCAVSLDQRKAFDMVDRNFLYQALEKIGFHNTFIRIIKLLYSDTVARVQINGHLTDYFPLERGVRQGCPLSPLLYVIYIDALIRKFKKDLVGIPVCGSRVFVSAYADDLLLFCHKDELNTVFSICQQFQKATGSQVNVQKTKILEFPGCRVPPEYRVEQLKYLGINYSFRSHKRVVKNNYSVVYDVIEKKIGHISKLSISLKGKAIIVNTLLMPAYYHLSAVFLPASKQIKSLCKLVFSFLWGQGKLEVISRKIMCTPLASGGLGIVKLPERLQSFYLYSNLTRLVEANLPQVNPRLVLFRYNFSERVRLLYPQFFELREPHKFELTKPYQVLHSLLHQIRDRLTAAAPLAPAISQIHQWLIGKEEVLPLCHPPGDWSQQEVASIYKVISYGRVATPASDFIWRSIRGALKTGEKLRDFKIPNLRTACIFCTSELESVCHLYLFCNFLKPIRAILLGLAQDVVGRTTPERDILFLITGLSPARVLKSTQIFLVNLVGRVNQIIWFHRNDFLFSRRDAPDINSLVIQVNSNITQYKKQYLRVDDEN